jgi:hypothetical protein
MARYFAGNTLATFLRSKSTVLENTTAGRFDSAYVPSCINGVANDDAGYFETPAFSAVAPPDFWLHFELYNNTGAGNRVTLFNGSTNAYRIVVSGSSTTGRLQYWNTVSAAWVDVGSTFGLSGATRYRLDLHIVPGTSMELWSDEVTSLASGSVGANPVTTIDKVRFHPGGAATAMQFSQMFAEDSDTRGKKYMQAALNALGSYTDGSGAVGDINETVVDDLTIAQLTATGNKRSYTHSGITVPSGFIIGAAVASARARVGGGTVTNAKLGIDSGATYSGGSNLGPNSQFGPINRILETDPDTGLEWLESGFDAAEIVLEAA